MHPKILTQFVTTLVQVPKKINNDTNAQTSVEIILLIGSILTISLITGTYIMKISSQINSNFTKVLEKGRTSLINKL